MNYKELFNRVRMLLSSPAKAWREIAGETDGRKVLGTFVYPMIGLCGLSVFIGTFIGNTTGVVAFQVAMTRCCGVFVSLFGGYFLAVYLLGRLGNRMFRIESGQENRLVGYSMVVTFVLCIIDGLFSLSLLRWILQFYMLFVVFEGSRTLMRVEETKLTRYTLVASLVIIACPILIQFIFDKLSHILN